jgi:amino-acid N-acetyltransferase
MRTRNAILPDAPQIEALIADYANKGVLLQRTLAEICENIRDFIIVEEKGRIVGCGALHLYGPHLCEVRSIAVDPSAQGHGVGRLVVNALLKEAERQKVGCVCLFTRIPDFFGRMGFTVAQREALPDKIYQDCLRCPKLHDCDEVAMVRGELPSFAILRPANEDRLVTLST